MTYEYRCTNGSDGFVVSDDPARLNVTMIHAFLAESYWAKGIPRETVERSIAHSLSFGVYADALVGGSGEQVGFARVISDRATFAYLADVFVREGWRGRGLSLLLMEAIVTHPDLKGLRQWLLMTADAHGVYSKFEFARTTTPERIMVRRPPIAYGMNALISPEKKQP